MLLLRYLRSNQTDKLEAAALGRLAEGESWLRPQPKRHNTARLDYMTHKKKPIAEWRATTVPSATDGMELHSGLRPEVGALPQAPEFSAFWLPAVWAQQRQRESQEEVSETYPKGLAPAFCRKP